MTRLACIWLEIILLTTLWVYKTLRFPVSSYEIVNSAIKITGIFDKSAIIFSMTETPNSQDRMRAALVLVATIGTIVLNGLSATGYINGVTPEVISDKYPTILTPAGYAFTIWSLIYVGMLAFSMYQLLPANIARFRSVRSVYIASCVLNCGWVFFWHREQIGVCLAVILALAISLLLINVKFRTPNSLKESLFTKTPFGIYFGWVTCAAIVNFAVFLAYMGVTMPSGVSAAFGAICIVVAAGLTVIVRWKLENYLYAFAVAWALTAIAVKQSGNTPIVVAAAFGAVTCLVTAGSVVTSLKDSTSE